MGDIYIIPQVHRCTNASKTEGVTQQALQMKENEEAVKDEVILTGGSSSARSVFLRFPRTISHVDLFRLFYIIFLNISKFLQGCTPLSIWRYTFNICIHTSALFIWDTPTELSSSAITFILEGICRTGNTKNQKSIALTSGVIYPDHVQRAEVITYLKQHLGQ